MMSNTTNVLGWKLRRVAAGLRQQDVASLVGISTTRYSAIERGEILPSELDRRLIERTLPHLSIQILADQKVGKSIRPAAEGERKKTFSQKEHS